MQGTHIKEILIVKGEDISLQDFYGEMTKFLDTFKRDWEEGCRNSSGRSMFRNIMDRGLWWDRFEESVLDRLEIRSKELLELQSKESLDLTRSFSI